MGETCDIQTRIGRKRVLQSPVKPHFFQPLLPGFLHNFCIPKSFLYKYLNLKKLMMTKDKEATNVIRLRSRGRRRPRWKVKIEVGDDEKVHLNKGWKKFASDNDLRVGDFLVFKYRGKMVFDVIVFAPTGCERDVMDVDSSMSATGDHVKPSKRSKKNCDKNDSTHEAAAAFVPSSYPYYRTTIQPSCYTWPGIVIPRNFVKSHLQIIKRGVDEITLIDEQQRSWELSLRCRKHGTVAIGNG